MIKERTAQILAKIYNQTVGSLTGTEMQPRLSVRRSIKPYQIELDHTPISAPIVESQSTYKLIVTRR